jgi:hypothetical protein
MTGMVEAGRAQGRVASSHFFIGEGIAAASLIVFSLRGIPSVIID